MIIRNTNSLHRLSEWMMLRRSLMRYFIHHKLQTIVKVQEENITKIGKTKTSINFLFLEAVTNISKSLSQKIGINKLR